MLHHSATKDGPTVSWGAIEDFHVNTNGWNDIGYHYGVELIGGRYYTMVGRSESEDAAACKEAGMNRHAIHVCLIGNFDDAPPDPAMLEAAKRRILLPIMRRHSMTPENVIGHRDAGLIAGFDWRKGQYKSCPGRAFDLDLVRRLLR